MAESSSASVKVCPSLISARASSTFSHMFHSRTASYRARPEVVHDPFTVRLLPPAHYLKSRVDFAHSLIAEVEKIGVKEGEVCIALASPGHIPPCQSPHRVGVVFVLNAKPLVQCGIEEICNVASRVNMRRTRLEEFVNDYPVGDVQVRSLLRSGRRF